jgi:hypothetical protein
MNWYLHEIGIACKAAEAEFGDDGGWIKFGLVHSIIVLFDATTRKHQCGATPNIQRTRH